MSEPYTPQLITRLLRAMNADELAAVTPSRFNTWPARVIVPTATVATLIDNERAARVKAA